MKALLTIFAAALLGNPAHAVGFTDSNVLFYGEVRQVGGAGTALLQSGQLEMTFVNQGNPENAVTLTAELAPTGAGTPKPFSYSLQVPLAYLPEPQEIGSYLAIGGSETSFQISSITIDGTPATQPDGSNEFYGLSFANRGDQYRLDLLVVGESTDTDGDGLPDWYEELYGLDETLSDSGTDFDSDGWSNLEEFRRGSNPAVSNRDPQLATTEIVIPESGEAGCFLQIYDSDTPPADLNITVDPTAMAGIELRWDGTPLATETTVTGADLAAGRLTMCHLDPAIQELTLPLTWNDGGEDVSGSILVHVTTPSTTTGNDAALWLDANSLPTAGEPVSSWTDRSGNSRDTTQPLPAHQPVVSTAGANRAVHFEGGTSHLFFQDPALPLGDHTVLVSYQSEGSPTNPQVLMSSNRGFLRLDPTAQAISYPGAPRYQIDGVAVRGHESTLQSSATSIFRREDSTLQNIFGLFYNGEATTAETLDPVLPTLGARRLALPGPEPIQDGFRGQLHELLVFPTALPEQKLRDVHDYLESKWRGAIVWDLSTQLPAVTLTAAGPGRHIIRGGHGKDFLRGGEADNTLSGGPGDDVLTGNVGVDRFVYGGVDTGRDILIDFDLEKDVIDFSSLFWGQTGDARSVLGTRLDTNFDGPIPTLDTVLILQRPDTTVQEIVLRDRIIGEPQLIQLIVEGRIGMGALSIPTDVALSLAAGSEDTGVLQEDLSENFTVEVTRGGDGLPGALDVPLGFFEDALGHDFLMEGVSSKEGQRAVVRFARGETSKFVTFRPVPDVESEGLEHWETAVLPHFRYAISGSPVARSVSDDPIVTLAVLEADALVATAQAAHLRVTREGSLTSPLTVSLDLKGSAVEGLHLAPVPRQLLIPSGQPFADLLITTQPGWDGAQTRMAVVHLVAQADYQIGNPHEATVYAAHTAGDADGIGFDRWVLAATAGETASLHDLLLSEHAGRIRDYLRAYALGDAGPDSSNPPGLSLRIVDNAPELTTRIQTTLPDLHWQVQDRTTSSTWTDVRSEFSEELTSEGLRLLGPPLDEDDRGKLYRLTFGIDSPSGLSAGTRALGGTSRYGLRGSAAWTISPTSGNLTTGGGAPGEVQRLLVEVKDPTILNFEMSVSSGDGSDLFTFFIDGAEVAITSGAPVVVNQTLEPIETSILMWEYRHSTGTAGIRTLK